MKSKSNKTTAHKVARPSKKKWASSTWIPIVLTLGLLALGMLFIWFSNADEREYRRGQHLVMSVLEAEKKYYDRHGEFTAKMDELEVELPAFSQETYEESRMEFDHGWFEWPASYKAQTAKGDYFVVRAEGLQRSTRDAALLTIVFFPAHVPAGYEVLYGRKYSSRMFTIMLCNPEYVPGDSSSTPASIRAKERVGERFCERMGAKAVPNGYEWRFPASSSWVTHIPG